MSGDRNLIRGCWGKDGVGLLQKVGLVWILRSIGAVLYLDGSDYKARWTCQNSQTYTYTCADIPAGKLELKKIFLGDLLNDEGKEGKTVLILPAGARYCCPCINPISPIEEWGSEK